MRTRAEFPALLTTLGLTGTIVEVGTYQGDFAKVLLDGWPGTLICVDAWRYFDGHADILNHPQPLMEQCYRMTLEKLQPYEHRCQVYRLLSVEAARRFARDGMRFDAVYLDAGHGKADIEADLHAWFPLIKPGGILAGHDYLDGLMANGYPADFGVKTAVNEFCKAHNLTLHITTDEPSPTWWTVLP